MVGGLIIHLFVLLSLVVFWSSVPLQAKRGYSLFLRLSVIVFGLTLIDSIFLAATSLNSALYTPALILLLCTSIIGVRAVVKGMRHRKK